MPQHLRDLHQGDAGRDHFAGHRVAQAVSAYLHHPARRHARRTVEETVSGAIGPKGALAQEHLSSLAPRPAALQIGGDRPTHIRRQRQPIRSSALAAHHQFACPPVDVIEPQPGHIFGPQPQPQHRGDQRVVASPDRRTTITASKQRVGIRLGDPLGSDERRRPVAGSAACDRSASTSPSMKQKRRNDRSPATKNWVALTDTAADSRSTPRRGRHAGTLAATGQSVQKPACVLTYPRTVPVARARSASR